MQLAKPFHPKRDASALPAFRSPTQEDTTQSASARPHEHHPLLTSSAGTEHDGSDAAPYVQHEMNLYARVHGPCSSRSRKHYSPLQMSSGTCGSPYRGAYPSFVPSMADCERKKNKVCGYFLA